MSIRSWLLAMATVIPGLSMADELSGEVSIGYRNVSVDGYATKYAEDVNLEDGPRLFQASLSYLADTQGGNGPDALNVELYGFGGDPFESARLEVRKYGKWLFKAVRQRSDYAYDDILVLPENSDINGSTGGDFHRYDFERVRDDVSLQATLSDRASASVGFERYGRRGESTTTLDIERDEFEMEKPVDEEMRLFRAAFRYRWDKLALTVEERLRDFESNSSIFLAGASEGENPNNLTTLDDFFLDQPYEYSGHEHVVRIDAWPIERLELQFAALLGNLDMESTSSEGSQGTNFTGNAYTTSDSSSVSAERDTKLFELDLSYAFSDRLMATTGVARRDFEQFASGESGAVSALASDWNIATTSFEAGLQFAANRKLTVSAGWYVDQRDVETNLFTAGNTTTQPHEETSTNGFYASVDYRPGQHFSVRASINDTDIDDPFTLAAPADVRRYRLRGRYAFDNGLSVTAAHSRTDSANAPSNWSSDIRQNSLRASYTSTRWVLAAGVSEYDGMRQVNRTVTGGTRQDLFVYTWTSQTSDVDASLVFNASERWTIGGAFRRYDNDGSINVARDELSGFAQVLLPLDYALRLNVRDIDFGEDNIEFYDARIVEASIRLSF